MSTPVRLLSEKRGLTRQEAADYIGVGKTKFDELVSCGRMPKPKRIDGCVRWDRWLLDEAFSALGDEPERDTSWDDVA